MKISFSLICSILNSIDKNTDKCITNHARLTETTYSYTTMCIKELEKRMLVETIFIGRRRVVNITPKGKSLLTSINQTNNELRGLVL